MLDLAPEALTDIGVEPLSETLIGEIFKAVGLAEDGWARHRFGLLFRRATDRLSQIGVTFDRLCDTDGFAQAAEWALTNWCKGILARGVDTVPDREPLLVVSNHPGTYDALVITSRLKREDLRIFSSDIPFLKLLPHASRHFVFLNDMTQTRAQAAREGIRHLEHGGAVLIYGSGQIDPDPALSEEAPQHVDRWSRSIELFLRHVPDTKLLLSVVSHAISPRWARSPLAWFRRLPLDKRRLVEFGQVIQQLLFPGSLYLSPRLSLGEPIATDDLRAEVSDTDLLTDIIAREKALISEHLSAFPSPQNG